MKKLLVAIFLTAVVLTSIYAAESGSSDSLNGLNMKINSSVDAVDYQFRLGIKKTDDSSLDFDQLDDGSSITLDATENNQFTDIIGVLVTDGNQNKDSQFEVQVITSELINPTVGGSGIVPIVVDVDDTDSTMVQYGNLYTITPNPGKYIVKKGKVLEDFLIAKFKIGWKSGKVNLTSGTYSSDVTIAISSYN